MAPRVPLDISLVRRLRGSRRFAASRLQRLPPEGFPLRPLTLW
jgi:hypothetical protein